MMAASKSKPPRKPKSSAELWDKLQADADLDRLKHLSSSDLDAEIRAAGGDPDAIGRRGAALATKHLPERTLDWKERAKARKDAMDRSVGEWPQLAGLSRKDLLERLRAARIDARFSAPIVAAFRKRTEEESTDDELRAILEEIEVLRRLHPPKDE
jgi:hypothetical protein